MFGDVDILAEQHRAFRFNWAVVSELGSLAAPEPEIDYTRIFASRMYGFSPEQWGMLGFTREAARDSVLVEMGDKPIYVVFFCSASAEIIEGSAGRVTIAKDDRARVLGIAEVQPVIATPETHISQEAREEVHALWGKLPWEYGLAISRAWKMIDKPMTNYVLPNARSLSRGPTNSVVKLTEEEKRYVRQYALEEANVYGQERRFVRVAERPPMNHTYLAICENREVLQKARAPAGTKLVKIGVSADTTRRLEEINGHHYAVIFGLEFRMYATKRWNSQADALARETMALEWAEERTSQASGEYFFMTDEQISEAITKVRPPTQGR